MMKVNSRLAYSIIAVAFAATPSSHAGELPIDLSTLANLLWTSPFCNNSIVNGSTFPSGSHNFAGVPFGIPVGPNNYWSGAVAGNCGSGAVRLTVPVGVPGATSVFALLNTFRGQPGPSADLFITFTGSAGATATQPLVGGVNVRDYNNDGFQNTINNTSSIQVWTNGEGQRLDRQEYILPATFGSQVLTSVTITDTGSYDLSRAMFSALTVSTCRSYVHPDIHTAGGPVTYHPASKLYTQELSVGNVGTQAPVNGPVFIVLDLPAGVSVKHQAGQTSCWAPIGSPYVIAIPPGSSLAPGTSKDITLVFSGPAGTTITYTPLAVWSVGPNP